LAIVRGGDVDPGGESRLVHRPTAADGPAIAISSRQGEDQRRAQQRVDARLGLTQVRRDGQGIAEGQRHRNWPGGEAWRGRGSDCPRPQARRASPGRGAQGSAQRPLDGGVTRRQVDLSPRLPLADDRLQAGHPQLSGAGAVSSLAGNAPHGERHRAGLELHRGHNVIPPPQGTRLRGHVVPKDAAAPNGPRLAQGGLQVQVGAEITGAHCPAVARMGSVYTVVQHHDRQGGTGEDLAHALQGFGRFQATDGHAQHRHARVDAVAVPGLVGHHARAGGDDHHQHGDQQCQQHPRTRRLRPGGLCLRAHGFFLPFWYPDYSPVPTRRHGRHEAARRRCQATPSMLSCEHER